MKERPILFSGPMVRALLDGSKTQTRRVLKGAALDWISTPTGFDPQFIADAENRLCPYGQIGDQLWVRENFQPFLNDDCDGDMHLANWKTGENYHCTYPATDGIHEFMDADDNLRSSVKPSIHMPRWASRITLEITNVRIERLQDISQDDSIAEGIARQGSGWRHYGSANAGECMRFPRNSYSSLWDSINGPESWDANPWVWVVEFRRMP